jgi:hypothetical protein
MAARLKFFFVETIAKITSADYPELLAAVDAGTSQRELALVYDCAPSLVDRHVAKAKRARAASAGEAGVSERRLSVEPQTGSMREILEARIRDPRTSARDLASLVNAQARLDAVEPSAAEAALRASLRAAKQRIYELERARIGLPRFFPGVNEWFDALPADADVERWSELPGAPVELVTTRGVVHMMLPDDAALFAEHLGWRPPPVFEPDEELIEEWRARIAAHDARRVAAEPEN